MTEIRVAIAASKTGTECPLWTDPSVKDLFLGDFSVRVLIRIPAVYRTVHLKRAPAKPQVNR